MAQRRAPRWRALIAIAATTLALLTPTAAAVAAPTAETVHTYTATPGDVASDRFSLTADGTDVFVAKYSNRSNNRMHVARFASDEATPSMVVKNSAPITSWKIFPERYYPASAVTVDGDTLRFDMSPELAYAIVQINGADPQLAIVNDPLEQASAVPDAAAANVVDVSSYVTDLSGATDETANIVRAIDDLYSDDSKDTLVFPNGAYTYAGLDLRGRTKPVTIYVAEGALLKNRIQPTMEAMEPAIGIWDSANITISGRGVFDGNGFANYDTANGGWRHDAATSQHQGGVMVVRSQNITFNDTLMRDAKQWNWETHTAKNVTFNNIKGLTPYAQPWVDGLDLASGQNLTVNGALTLGNDDTFASGHYNPSDQFTADPDRLKWDTEDTFGISVNDTLGWSAGAGNGIRLGHAAYGHTLRDYTFDNVNYTGFSTGGNGITVQNPDSGVSTYPRYDSIVIRDSSFDTSRVGANFAVRGKGGAGADDMIDTVTLQNVWFSTNNPSSVSNTTALTIKNLTVAGERITRLSQTPLTFTNVTGRDLDFPEDVAPVITDIAPQSVPVGETLSFTLSATEGDGDTITLSVDTGALPAGASFDAATGTFTWTPTQEQVGNYTVNVTATDARGATDKTSVGITVTDPTLTVTSVTAAADTHVQTWNSEQNLNYGDNELVRMLNPNVTAYGALGQDYVGNETGKDAKLTYLTFDTSSLAELTKDADLEKVELQLTYFGPAKTALTGTDTIKVGAVHGDWIEGDGKTTPPARTNTVTGGMTWLTKPAVDAATVRESAPFTITAAGKVGSDGTYTASQTPVGTVATVDVTDLIEASTDEDTLSLAVNETKKLDLLFVSTEGAERNPNATGMAPRLVVTTRPHADATALNEAITSARALDPADYAAAGWSALQVALASAEKIAADDSATQAAVDTATASLIMARDAMISAVISIDVDSGRTSYSIGDTFDAQAITVTGAHADGIRSVLPPSDYTITGFDASTAGTRTVTVLVSPDLSATDVAVSRSFDVVITGDDSTPTTPGDAWGAVSLSSNTVPQGGSFTVTVNELRAGEQISAELHSDPIVVTGIPAADTTGTTVFTVTVPTATPAGAHALVLSSPGRADLTTPITVTATDDHGGTEGQLAATGTELPWGLALAAAALTLFGLLLQTSRRRRHLG